MEWELGAAIDRHRASSCSLASGYFSNISVLWRFVSCIPCIETYDYTSVIVGQVIYQLREMVR